MREILSNSKKTSATKISCLTVSGTNHLDTRLATLSAQSLQTDAFKLHGVIVKDQGLPVVFSMKVGGGVTH